MILNVEFQESIQQFETEFEENKKSLETEFEDLRTIHGKDGKSAYQIAVDNGYIGTEEEWLESLNGKDGIDGKNGADGKNGYTPIKGKDYFTDSEVSAFKEEVTPKKGVDYFDGKDGRDGTDGKNGNDGKDGYTPQKGVDYFDGYTPQKGIDYNDGYTPVKGVDYTDGEDGHTPEKGVDYWTESDKAAMVSDTIQAIDTPILSKTYDDIRYSDTAIYHSTYPYVKFGEIKPIDLDRPCSIALRLKVEVNNTDGSMPIAVYGEYLVKLYFTQDVVSTTNLIPRYKYLAFETCSKFPSTGYRPIYTFITRGLNNKGFVEGNSIPFGWVRGSTDYKCNTCTRNISIDVLECDNCTASLVEEITHTNLNGFIGDGVVGNYDGVTTFSDLGTIGNRHTGDHNTDTYTRLNDNAYKQVVDYPLYRYDLFLEKLDGTFAPLRTNNKSSTTANGGVAVPNTTSAFKIDGRILYYAATTTVSANAFTANGDIEYTGDGRYLSTNTAGTIMKIDGEPLTATNAKALYLKVKDNGDLTFSLDPDLPADLGYHLTQILPTENDGYLYIQLGRMANHLYQYRLTAEHDIYYHDGTRLRRY